MLKILKNTNMEEMIEFKVRVMASEKLGIDLSSIDCKKFIKGIVESFLLAAAEDEGKKADANFQGEAQELVHEQ